MGVRVRVRGPEDYSVESVLSFYPSVLSRDRTHVLQLGVKHLKLTSHLTGLTVHGF